MVDEFTFKLNEKQYSLLNYVKDKVYSWTPNWMQNTNDIKGYVYFSIDNSIKTQWGIGNYRQIAESTLEVNFAGCKHMLMFSEDCNSFISVRSHDFVLTSGKLMNIKIAVMTLAAGSEYREIVKHGLDSKNKYCEMHGYDHIMIDENDDCIDHSRPLPWSKIPALQKYLPKYDYIYFSDADVIIKNFNIKLEDMFYCYDINKVMILTKDGADCINTSNFFIKNCPDSFNMLSRMDALTQFTHHPFWEQQAYIHLYETDQHIRNISHLELNHRLFNAYIHVGKNRYRDGDFLVHFASFHGDELRKVMEQYKN